MNPYSDKIDIYLHLLSDMMNTVNTTAEQTKQKQEENDPNIFDSEIVREEIIENE